MHERRARDNRHSRCCCPPEKLAWINLLPCSAKPTRSAARAVSIFAAALVCSTSHTGGGQGKKGSAARETGKTG